MTKYTFRQKKDELSNVSGAAACTCSPATLDTKLWNGVGLIVVGRYSPSDDGWVV